MKKLFVLQLAFVVLLFSCVSCKGSDQQIKDSPSLTNPNTEQFAEGYPDYGVDFESEQDYSNIVTYTEFETYSSDVEEINITVKNNNPGKGFYLYMIPFIEKWENDKWVRLNYRPPSINYENRWAFCGIEGDKTSQYSTMMVILSEFLNDKLSAGDYRAVIFVGANIIYAPFKIIN